MYVIQKYQDSMKFYSSLFLYVILMLMPVKLQSQSLLNRFSIDYGRIRNLQTYFENEKDKYSYYPEFKIGGNMKYKFLEWELYYGFWDDGVEDFESVRVTDGQSYEYSGDIIGVRFSLMPEEFAKGWTLPVRLITGLSYHFNSLDYLGGSDLSGKNGHDVHENLLMFEFGGGFHYQLVKLFRLRGGAIYLFNLYNSRPNYMDYGEDFTYKLGVDFYFKEL